MESESSSFIDTTYSVDVSIANYIKRKRDERKKNEVDLAVIRKEIFENFVMDNGENFFLNFDGMHFYKFTEKRIKFGFNPSEVAHVSKKIKFICILKYTGKYWIPGRNTIPANWKQRIFDLFYKDKSVKDDDVQQTIHKIHTIFMEWAEIHEEFRKKKIEKYRNKIIDFFELDSEDEELYLSLEERRELREKRERILIRMIPPEIPHKRIKTAKKRNYGIFEAYPDLGID